MRIIYLLSRSLLILLAASTVDAVSADPDRTQKKQVLSIFFKNLLQETEVGYVFLGVKPLCTVDFCSDKALLPIFPNHAYQVAIWKGMEIWKTIQPSFSNIVIQPSGDEEEGILVYHRELLYQIIENHLDVFQTIFGSSLEADKIYKSVITGDYSFSSSTQSKVISGILLGYGLKNSLLGSRWEEIQEALYVLKEEPPFQSAIKKIPEKAQGGKHLLLRPYIKEKGSLTSLSPSHGFKTLEEEFKIISEKVALSSPTLVNDKPSFIFGRVKGDPEVDAYIAKLEKTQKELQQLLQSSQLLPFVLEKTLGKEDIDEEEVYFSDQDQKDFNFFIAKSLWNFYSSNIKNTLTNESFLKGFKEDSSSSPIIKWHPFHEIKREILLKIVENVNLSEKIFSNIEKDLAFQAAVPQKVYFRSLSKGEGAQRRFTKARLKYEVFDGTNRRISFREHPVDISLNETIPGFAHGIQGMREGETREVLIHPSFAYGIHTFLERGMPIRTVVTLVQVLEDPLGNLPPLDPIDLSFLLEKNFLSECEEVWEKEAFHFGWLSREKLRAFPHVNSEKIYQYLEDFSNQKKADSPLSEEEKTSLLDFYWKEYFPIDPS